MCTKIPCYYQELKNVARSKGWSDGAEAIAKIRNSLVHSTRSNRHKLAGVNGMALVEAKRLVLTYIELVILAILNYSGYYSRRMWDVHKGDDEARVPWVKECT